ncbi:MAG: alpha-amylase family glycosyl hydrolase [Aerococcus sp.]|nr:alpha-amylase family glycosyl hydrolase [Aerococcus sp.]
MKNTTTALRNQIIYSIFTRNFTPEGTLQAIIPKLDRIKALGTDIIWLLPFYPNGEVHRKGTIGSPYAIQDYRAIDPNQGSIADLESLVAAAHARDMKVIIDIVYNHTSPDSILATTHPDWFYHKPNGEMGNHVGDWYDVVDLDYTKKALWDYQIETLCFWAQYVDGFRCDVAPLVPLEFWQRARTAVADIKKDTIWLAESVERNFITTLRSMQLTALSDSELYQAFDLTYDYDISEAFKAYRDQTGPLSDYVKGLAEQDTTYPANYVKMHHLENHDNDRIAAHIETNEWWQWHAFLYFLKGASLIYNGQEVAAKATPSLFDPDVIHWDETTDHSEQLRHLAKLKKALIPTANTDYQLTCDDSLDTAIIRYQSPEQTLTGIFNLRHHEGAVSVPLTSGTYYNHLTDQTLTITDNRYPLDQTPAWLSKIEK